MKLEKGTNNFIYDICMLLTEKQKELNELKSLNITFDSDQTFKEILSSTPSQLKISKNIGDENCNVFNFTNNGKDCITIKVVSYDNFLHYLKYVSKSLESAITILDKSNFDILEKIKFKFYDDKSNVLDKIRKDKEYENVVLETFRVLVDTINNYTNNSRDFVLSSIEIRLRSIYIETCLNCYVNRRLVTNQFAIHVNRNLSSSIIK